MKILKVIGIVLAALIGLLLLVGAFAPKNFTVERSTIIEAPKDVIYSNISHLKNHDKWSPWAQKDSEMKKSYEGEDGKVGFVSKWESEMEDVGVGEQEITKLVSNESVETELRFSKPRSGVSQGFLNMEDADKGSKVTWGFHTTVPFPFNVMMLTGGMDKAVGPDFENGLSSLKKLCESAPAGPSAADMKIEVIKFAGKKYVGKRDKVKMAEIKGFYETHLTALAEMVGAQKIEMDGMPSGLYYDWDEKTMITDMVAAIPVKKSPKVTGDYQIIDIPAGKALRIDYYGNYDGLGAAHEAMAKYLEANKLEGGQPAIEEYVTDPGTEPDPSKYLTKITYLIK